MKINKIILDIETYSSNDLTKCGVYKYVEADDFEILLAAISINDAEPVVYDLASGEKLPDEIVSALSDETIIKTAYNCNFERICLSRYLGYKTGHYLSPRGWHDTMILALYNGLPRALKQVGEVLSLEKQKMDEGKDLIRYFCVPCKPTKSNGGRTRNLPGDAPDKWETMKKYNKRDVVTEMEIEERLKNYQPPVHLWEEFYIDQRINDLGIMVDTGLISSAIEFDAKNSTELTESMKDITSLDNPNSVSQLKTWLSENGLEADSLGKKEVEKYASEYEGTDIGKLLELRKMQAKSSIKKYYAMEEAKCSDDRVRGMFMFYGAKTGRFCLTGDHEVLTDSGEWVRLDEWKGGNIVCWNPAGEQYSFQRCEPLCFDYDGDMYCFDDRRIHQMSTPDHKMYVTTHHRTYWCAETVENISKMSRPIIPYTGYRQQKPSYENDKLRVLIMVQADGYYTDSGDIRLGFAKTRKAERCKTLLRKAEIPFKYKVFKNVNKDKLTFTILARDVPLWLKLFKNKTFDTWLFDMDSEVFFEELVYWDGYQSAANSIQYSTCNKRNADLVQAFAHLSGRSAQMKVKVRDNTHPNWSDAYVLDIWLRPIKTHTIVNKATIQKYSGKVYCASTPTGYFMVRRKGRVWITGNSGRAVQLQNLRRNNLQDLDEARSLVYNRDFGALQALYDDPADVLSQLVRTAFIAKPGRKFVVADFSAIECRVVAWLAGEQWVLDAFANNQDIYCATAEKMFHVPVVKHGINGELRQKGKGCVLGCGYGGGPGALIAMGALESGMKEEELKPLVDSWRAANPHIVKFWSDIDRAIKYCIRNKTTIKVGKVQVECRNGMLFIHLPSGRRLSYVRPNICENRFGSESFCYWGLDMSKKWVRIETFGGKCVENITQAVARDVLMNSMFTLKDYDIVAHCHDELIIEVPEDTSVDLICKKMAEVPSWAEGLILRADGYETKYYKKD